MKEPQFHIIKRTISERDVTGRKRQKSVYYARFFQERYADGRAKYFETKATGETNKTSAASKAAKMLQDGTIQPNISRESLKGFLLDFWTSDSDYVRNRQVDTGSTYSTKYLSDNRRRIEDYVIPWMEARDITRLDQVTRAVLKEWRADLAEGKIVPVRNRVKGRPHSRLSPVTANKVRQALWVPLQYAVDERMLPEHPGSSIRRIGETEAKRTSKEKRANKILTFDELQILFAPGCWHDDSADYHIARAVALFCISVGARQGEARGLQFKNIDLERGIVDIRTNYQDGEGLKPPKLDSVRTDLPLGDIPLQSLRLIYDRYPHTVPGPEDFVFPSTRNRDFPIPKLTLNKALKRAMKISGLAETRPGVGFHDLRHTWASHSSTSLPDAVRKYALGHRSGDITDLYTHATQEYQSMLLEFQNKIIAGVTA